MILGARILLNRQLLQLILTQEIAEIGVFRNVLLITGC